jgi:hypothetical protein
VSKTIKIRPSSEPIITRISRREEKRNKKSEQFGIFDRCNGETDYPNLAQNHLTSALSVTFGHESESGRERRDSTQQEIETYEEAVMTRLRKIESGSDLVC